jgi:hypothetical protein
MYTEHSYAVKNPQNVEIFKKKIKFLMKKTKLTFESFFIPPECSYHFKNHNQQLKRPQKYFNRNFYLYLWKN